MIDRTTIISCPSKDEYAELQMLVGSQNLNYAIGRLASWAIFGDSDQYAGTCKIFLNHHAVMGTELTAHYHNAKGMQTYVIGAVWRDDTNEFTFHS